MAVPAVFEPAGFLQLRSMAHKKEMSRIPFISMDNWLQFNASPQNLFGDQRLAL
jgi:hypothetical protein